MLKKMDSERVLAAVGPLLWVAISYVDPGKWAAALEGGARFGFDLVLLVLIINFTAILCQYMSARISIATGRNLTEICSKEYDGMTCVLLGIQAEVSMIVLDLTMVLGTAYGLNAVFGIDLFTCVFLTCFDVILFPLLASLLGHSKAKMFSISLACFVLALCVSGVLMGFPENSLSISGMLSNLNGENAYALMSILGANIMPHNFYLHSSIVQQDQGRTSIPTGALCHDHFFATFCVFSGVFLVNFLLINLAANVFFSSGLTSLTLQDALSLLDQGFWGSLASIALLFMIFANQLVLVTWSFEKQAVASDFFGLEIPGWLHCATIRIIATIPAVFCVLNSGSDGIFPLLIFAQVVIALLLPSSMIPLYRVASSRPIMGAYKISHLVEFLALLSLIGILGLKVVFVIELIFGSSDWVTSLKWNIGSSVSISFLNLLIVALVSLCMVLWLAITPLRSASSGIDAPAMNWDKQEIGTHALNWDEQAAMAKSSIDGDLDKIKEAQYELENVENQEPNSSLEKSFRNQQNLSSSGSELNLPETLLDSDINIHSSIIPDMKSELVFSKPSVGDHEAYVPVPEPHEINLSEMLETCISSTKPNEMVEKTLKLEGNGQMEKDESGHPHESEELSKTIPEDNQSSMSEGPGSFRSLSGKLDDVGSGTGSLSRLGGLGRAARKQLTSILDEFWEQLFNFHGQLTYEAKAKRLDVVLGINSKVDLKSSTPVKLEGINRESMRFFPSTGGKGSDFLKSSTLYNSPMHSVEPRSIGSPVGVQQGPALWSKHARLLDYVRDSNHNALESGERRYHSLHAPSASEIHNRQPVTIHGLNMISYLSQMAKEKGSDYQRNQLSSSPHASMPSIKPNIDSYSPSLGQKPQIGQTGLRAPPGFHNGPVYRNNSLKCERPTPELSSRESVDYVKKASGEMKFHSLPNISGLYNPRGNYSLTDNSSQWNNSVGYGPSIGHRLPEQSGLSASSWDGDFSLQVGTGLGINSLWSKQPYEQFGVADKSPSENQEAPSIMDMEAKLLQSFRNVIVKLLKLEGANWLFRQNDGADEDLIVRVAARERFLYEVETMSADRKLGSTVKIDDLNHSKFTSIPNCGDGCVWQVDLIVSFGVWCIHRILELSLMESRPELWGKYTYVLNRLQGVIDLAFSKPRVPTTPCFCLQLPAGYQQKPSSPVSNSSLPPQSKLGRGKVTTAPMLLDIIKDVEIAISCRKGRSGTAAGDVAFPMGKENLASVLKRYKRRLSNKPVGSQDAGRKNALSSPQGL